MSKPIVIDLFCGLGGWSEGFLAEGYECIGYDIEAHDYGSGGYPGTLILQDVTTLHGSQFEDVACIVASPPCQDYSYMAMPWSRAKAKAAAIRADNTGVELEKLNLLFNACFRIQREACEAAGRHIPMVVENVRGAQPWVGRAIWHHGSFFLWGDVPALMPVVHKAQKFNPDGTGHPPGSWFAVADSKERGKTTKNEGGSWFAIGGPGQTVTGQNPDGRKVGKDWLGAYGGGFGWDSSPMRRNSSNSVRRKMASAMIAKIPLPLSQHIARTFKPDVLPPFSFAACAAQIESFLDERKPTR